MDFSLNNEETWTILLNCLKLKGKTHVLERVNHCINKQNRCILNSRVFIDSLKLYYCVIPIEFSYWRICAFVRSLVCKTLSLYRFALSSLTFVFLLSLRSIDSLQLHYSFVFLELREFWLRVQKSTNFGVKHQSLSWAPESQLLRTILC